MNQYQPMAAPPQALEAEQSVLGSMMIDSSCIDDVFALLTPSDFYDRRNAQIFEVIHSLHETNVPTDLVTVGEQLTGSEVGMTYLGDIARHTPGARNSLTYAKSVKDRSIRRQIIERATEIVSEAYLGEVPTTSIVDKLSNSGADLSIENTSANQRINEVIKLSLNEIEKRRKTKDALIGLSTGLVDLDHQLGGLQNGKLYTVAARPAHGKTTLAINIAERNAKDGKRVQVFTLEMTSDEIGMKLLSSTAGVEYDRVQSANLDEEHWQRLTAASGQLADKSLFVDDSTSLNMAQIKSRSRKVKKQYGLDLVIVDYLGLMETGDSGRHDLDISKITRAMKNMAKDLDIPVVMVCQLNRDCEKRTDKRPILNDLRDSGSIEQDSNVVIFIYRDEVYNEMSKDQGLAELLIRKNRGGRIGTVRVLFEGQFQRFRDLKLFNQGCQ